jgi:hypothetical protein
MIIKTNKNKQSISNSIKCQKIKNDQLRVGGVAQKGRALTQQV